MDDLQRVLDEHAIRRRLVEYCRGIDRLDVELVRGVYHPDGTDDHGSFVGLGVDFADYAVRRMREGCEATMHVIGNSIIDFAGPDTAFVESQVVAYQQRRDPEGPFLETFGGRYVDRFERRHGDWRIAHRLCVHDWDKVERLALAFPPEKFTEGVRSRADPSYRRD
jgi:SnoaL-like domain